MAIFRRRWTNRRSARAAPVVWALLVAGAWIAIPEIARAQGSAVEVRVLQTIDPVTGQTALQVVEDLLPAEVAAVQRGLERQGFGAPWRAGRLDPFTIGALQRFQTQRGLRVCACVSFETLLELDIRARVTDSIVLEIPVEPVGSLDRPPDDAPVYVDSNFYPHSVVLLAPLFPRKLKRNRKFHEKHKDPLHPGGRAGGVAVSSTPSPSGRVARPAAMGRVPMPARVPATRGVVRGR